ncbi:MAG: SDR family oxidoreductase [Alphaproteobacteria bacterium]
MSLRFDGKVAIITGAGGGLGRAHALELAKRGAKVVVNDLGAAVDGSGGSSEAAEKVVAEIKQAGGEAIANGSSVTDDKGVENLAKQTLDAFGRADILINNAGILRDKSFAKIEMKDFEFVVDVHLMGAVKVTRAFWPVMKEQQYGRVVMTTSSTGLYGNFGQTNYGAAKLGQVGFMNTLKIEGQKDNIKVNTICPVAATRMTEDLMPEEALAMLKPEFVTPGVICLVAEDAPTGYILCAGAGVFSHAEIRESEGAYLGREGLTAEKVLDAWDRISDMSRAKPYFQGGEQTLKIFELGR